MDRYLGVVVKLFRIGTLFLRKHLDIWKIILTFVTKTITKKLRLWRKPNVNNAETRFELLRLKQTTQHILRSSWADNNNNNTFKP